MILLSCATLPHVTRILSDATPRHKGGILARGVRYSLAQISRPKKNCRRLFRGTSTSTTRTAHRRRNRHARAPLL
eukprot:4917062-Pyramimonas_sp.AAC.1